jgi:hypothetical protein
MKIPVKCRVPNNSSWTVVQLRKESFTPLRKVGNEIFGHIDGIYVAIDEQDWTIAQEMWNYDTSTESNI